MLQKFIFDLLTLLTVMNITIANLFIFYSYIRFYGVEREELVVEVLVEVLVKLSLEIFSRIIIKLNIIPRY